MFQRAIQTELLNLAQDYPIVTLMGPRQSGKTTLVKDTFPDKAYLNLEHPPTREFAELDPEGFLARYPEGAILDEIQRLPSLLSYIQVIVDSRDQKGLFILTGSHQLQLHQAISQSLAGRTALLTLLPMSMRELNQSSIDRSLNDYLLHGFLPRIYKDHLDPTKAYRNYFQTYIERDVRQLIHLKDLSLFQRFMKLCAGRVGQLLNMNNLSNELGVSNPTIKHWLSILEASFVIVLLPPYFENIGKRLIKSPKLYFTEVGLATYLLTIENIAQLDRDPLRGHLVENLVVLELMKSRLNKGLDPQLYFYRDSHGNEIDVIHKTGQSLIPIEIKSSETMQRDFLKNLRFFDRLVGEKCPRGFLVYGGEHEQCVEKFEVLNYKHVDRIV